ncbi:MAG: extracellular solute-binding protein [Nitrososphaerota archaeon]
MSEKKEGSRRDFIKTAATGIVGLAVGAGIGYGASTMTAPAKPGATVTVTQTAPGPAAQFPFNLPRTGATPAERAINAANFLLQQHPEWKGTEIVLACVGGYQVGFDAMKPEWEQKTGTKITCATTPLPDFFDKMMQEAVTKTGSIDLLNIQPMYLTDLVEAGMLYQLDDIGMWLDARLRGRPDGYIYPLQELTATYLGKTWGFTQDGDVTITYYRKDLMNDPKEKEGFEKQYGYPLAPPNLITEYRDQAEYFYRPDKDMYGFTENREVTRNANMFYIYFNSKKWPNMYYFDDNMKPQLATKEGIEAAQIYVEMVKYGPPGLIGMLGTANYNPFAEGKVFVSMNFPSMSNTIQSPQAKSKDKWDSAPPCGWMVDGPGGKKILNRRGVLLANWCLAVNNHSKKKELAACAAVYFADPEKLVTAVTTPATWHDMSRYHMVGANADPRVVTARGPLLTGYEAAAELLTPMVSQMRGATEYNVSLSKNLHAAMSGTMDVVKALETTEKQWEELTERLGREKQLAGWLQLKKLYSTKA